MILRKLDDLDCSEMSKKKDGTVLRLVEVGSWRARKVRVSFLLREGYWADLDPTH
jgi:hypothetical protein